MNKIGVIIINYNGWQDTLECLESLKNIELEDNQVNIVLIDNKSINKSIENIEEWLNLYEYDSYNYILKPNILLKFIKAKQNYGFSNANNIGIKDCIDRNIDQICLLNNDTVVDRFFLINLLKEKKKLNYDLISGKIINYFNKEESFIGGYTSKLKCSGYQYNQDNSKNNITFLSGCLLLFDKKVIEKIGYLDENYFMYIEDVDFSYRAIKNNLKLGVASNSIIYHKEGRSTKNKASITYYNTRNRLYFACKNLNSIHQWMFNVYFLLNRFLKMILNPNLAIYIIKGYNDFKNNEMGKMKE